MASSNVIEILIKATDQTGNVVSGVAGKMRNALGGALKLGALGAGVGLGALTGFLALATKEAMEAEQVQAELNAVLESTAGIAGMTAKSANDLASKWAKVTMFSDDTILSGEAMLLTFTNIGKDVFPAATEATINLAQKFGDMEGAATMVGKALNDPTAGLTALTRVGVSFTEAQKEQIRTMQESGDLAGAQAIILGELERQYGGLAEAAGDTLAGKMAILKNRFLDIAEGVGMRLIPALTSVLDWAIEFADKAGPYVDLAINALIGLWTQVEPYLSQLGQWFVNAGTWVWGLVTDFEGTVAGIKSAFADADLATVATTLLDNIAKGVGDLATWAWDNLGKPVIDAIGKIDWSSVGNTLLDILTAIGTVALAIDIWAYEKIVTPIANALVNADWSKIASSGLKMLGQIVAGVGDIATWAWDKLITPLANALVNADWSGIADSGLKMLGQLVDGIGDFGEWMKFNIIYPIAERLLFADWSGIADTGLRMLGQIITGIGDFAAWVFDELITPLALGIYNADWSGIADSGLKMLAQIVTGIGDFAVWTFENLITPLALGIYNADWSGIADAGLKMLNQILAGMGDLGQWVVNNIINPIINGISGLGGQIFDKIKSEVGSVDIGGALGDVGNFLGGVGIPGFASGGYTGAGGSNEVAGVVHRNEFVVPERGALVLRGGGGGGTTYSLAGATINVFGVQDVRALLDQLGQEARRTNRALMPTGASA